MNYTRRSRAKDGSSAVDREALAVVFGEVAHTEAPGEQESGKEKLPDSFIRQGFREPLNRETILQNQSRVEVFRPLRKCQMIEITAMIKRM